MKITIGSTDSGKFVLPADTVTSTLIVYGGKGMGKTNFGSVLVEEMNRARLRWAVLDPMGVWWGLRHSIDGKGPGVECLILGGPHGDIPIEPTGGAVAADLVADEPVNVIIDFSRKPTGETWGVGEKIRFVTDYGKRLFERQGSLVNRQRREPIFQVLDEAARFIPQMIRAGEPQLAMAVSVWAQIVEEGRNNGIGVCLLTQRSARLNKDVAELADAMFAFRTVGPNSVGAIMDWLGEHAGKKEIHQFVEQVRALPRGSALVVSPGWLQFEGIVKIRARETFDSSATPKPGESARKVTGAAAKPDLAKYAERMKETIERAKENDPRALKGKIAELQKELEKANKAQPEGAPVLDAERMKAAIEKAVRTEGKNRDRLWMLAVREFHREFEKFVKETATAVQESFLAIPFREPAPIGEIAADVTVATSVVPAQAGNSVRKGGRGESPEPLFGREQSAAPAARVPANVTNGTNVTNGLVFNPLLDLSASKLRILEALAMFESLGRTAVDKKWIATYAGASATSSTYGNNLGALRSAGLIDYPAPGTAALTEKGRSIAPAIDVPDSPSTMFMRCKQIVSGPQALILLKLFEAYPEPIEKTKLAELVGASATSSTFGNNLGALRSAGMIEYPAPGTAKCAAWLHLE